MSEQLQGAESAKLIGELRQELQPLLQSIITHRFVAALEQGRVPHSALRVLAAQQFHIVSQGLQNIALLLSRFGHLPSRKKLNEFLQAEFAVRDAVLGFAKALGLDEAALQAEPKLLEALIFSYYETFICVYGTDADLITAFYFDAQVWIANALRVSRALQTHYGLAREDVAFFEMYANYQPKDEDVLPYIQSALERGASLGDCPGCKPDEINLQLALERGVTAQQIRESTRLLLEGEWHFWEAMAKVAGV
jgi:pyrroloquinoline quinone (PQQ) biosynthesis protein C